MKAFHVLTKNDRAKKVEPLAHLGAKFVPARANKRFLKQRFLKEFDENIEKVVAVCKFDANAILFRDVANSRVKKTVKNLKLRSRRNLSKKAKEAFEVLKSNTEFSVVPADKNLGLVAIDNSRLTELSLNVLNDLNKWELVPNLQPKDLQAEMTDLVKEFTMGYLWPGQGEVFIESRWNRFAKKFDGLPMFRGLPKIHKPTVALRPIVRSSSWILCGLSKELLPWVRDIVFGVCRKHKHLMLKMERLIVETEDFTFPKNSELITADITSMYDNMDLETALSELMFWAREVWSPEDECIPILIKGARLVLKNSFCVFHDRVYKRVKGINMGDSLGPFIAILYLARTELEALDKLGHIEIFWRRYIDDFLLIVEKEFITEIVSILKNLCSRQGFEITIETNNQQKEFLDMLLFKGKRWKRENKLDIRLYEKQLNLYQYVNFNSEHPLYVFRNIVKNGIRRALARTNNRNDFGSYLSKFKQRLLNRNFPPKKLKRWFRDAVHFEQRSDVIASLRHNLRRPNRESQLEQFPLIFTYTSAFQVKHTVKNILEDIWPLLPKQIASKGFFPVCRMDINLARSTFKHNNEQKREESP